MALACARLVLGLTRRHRRGVAVQVQVRASSRMARQQAGDPSDASTKGVAIKNAVRGRAQDRLMCWGVDAKLNTERS